MGEYGISIYPNPVKDVLNIRNTKGLELGILIFNAVGEKIKETHSAGMNTQVNMQDMPDGVYFIMVNNGKETFTGKIIKQ